MIIKYGVEIVVGKPPVFDVCQEKFGIKYESTYFAYDGKIYTSNADNITEDIVVHEKVHHRQQEEAGGTEKWWNKYLADDKFRLSQELEAYKTQYSFLKGKLNREELAKYVYFWSLNLAGKAYGGIIGVNEAIKQITK